MTTCHGRNGEFVTLTRHGEVGDVTDKSMGTSQVCHRLVVDVMGSWHNLYVVSYSFHPFA